MARRRRAPVALRVPREPAAAVRSSTSSGCTIRARPPRGSRPTRRCPPTRRAACSSTPSDRERTAASLHAATGDPAAIEAWQRLYATCARRRARALPDADRAAALARAELRALVGDDAAWDGARRAPARRAHRATLRRRPRCAASSLTDALIGTFADADDPTLRQNRCFLYHVIGNGTGDWDVPVGGMGAVTAALEARRARGRAPSCARGAEVTAVEPDRRRRVRSPTRAATGTSPSRGHVLGERRARGARPPAAATRRPASAARGRAAQGQPAARAAAAPARRRRRPAPTRSPAPSTSTRATTQLDARLRARRRAGGSRRSLPCEIYCHSLTDPSILGPELRAAGAQTLTCFALHMPARLFAADPDGARERALARHARLARQRARRADRRTASGATPTGGRASRRARPLDLEDELRPARRQHLPPRPRWPFAETEARGRRRWGVETDDAARARCAAPARGAAAASAASRGHNAAMAVLSGC